VLRLAVQRVKSMTFFCRLSFVVHLDCAYVDERFSLSTGVMVNVARLGVMCSNITSLR